MTRILLIEDDATIADGSYELQRPFLFLTNCPFLPDSMLLIASKILAGTPWRLAASTTHSTVAGFTE